MTPMQRLVLASCLFIGWIGYLAYLVAITRDPIILSRPQFLVADLYVIAELSGDDNPSLKVKITDVAWAGKDEYKALKGQDMAIEHLDKCQADNGWSGAGTYILPLTKLRTGYFLTEIPPSPGFDARGRNDLRIYRATAQTRQELADLIAEFHGQ